MGKGVLLWHVLVDPTAVEEVTGLVTESFLAQIIADRENAILRDMGRKHR